MSNSLVYLSKQQYVRHKVTCKRPNNELSPLSLRTDEEWCLDDKENLIEYDLNAQLRYIPYCIQFIQGEQKEFF